MNSFAHEMRNCLTIKYLVTIQSLKNLCIVKLLPGTVTVAKKVQKYI
jgi:hypothetical protein